MKKLQDLPLVILMKKWQDLPLVIFDEKTARLCDFDEKLQDLPLVIFDEKMARLTLMILGEKYCKTYPL